MSVEYSIIFRSETAFMVYSLELFNKQGKVSLQNTKISARNIVEMIITSEGRYK